MEKAAKGIASIVVLAAVLLAIMLCVISTEASAEVKPLEKGQVFKIGTCTAPGPGYGPNGGYETTEANIKQDAFPYNGEYITCIGTYTKNLRRQDYPEAYERPLYIAYQTREKSYYYTGGGSGPRFDYDTPDREYDYKWGDYLVYLIPGGNYNYPIIMRFASEYKGKPWGLQVLGGEGTSGNPFRFGLLFSEPYRVDLLPTEHGSVEMAPNAEAGEKVTLDMRPDLGYETGLVTMKKGKDWDSTVRQLRPNAEGQYSFTMPDADCEVSVEFVRKETLATISSSDGIAKSFDSFESALPDWKDGTTLTLYEGAYLNGPIEITDRKTLDLNGYVLKASGKDFVVKRKGSLTLMDSAPGRKTRFEGQTYTGGYLFGSVDGGSGYTATYEDDILNQGLIDVTKGSFIMNGGSLINQAGSERTWGIFADKGAKITVNDGYIKASKAIIMSTDQGVVINLAGGRYDLSRPSVVEMNRNNYDASLSITGGYYKESSILYDRSIARGYKGEAKADQADWQWKDFQYRIVPDPDYSPDKNDVIVQYVENLSAKLPADLSQVSKVQVAKIYAAYKTLSRYAKKLIPEEDLQKLQNAATYLAKVKETAYSSLKIKAGNKALLTWEETPDADGYQLWYKAKGEKAKKLMLDNAQKVKTTIKNLKAGKTYTFKIRPYTEVEDLFTGKLAKVYGKWSELKKARTK